MRMFALLALLCGCVPLASAADLPAPPTITKATVDGDRLQLNFDQPMMTWDDAGTFAAVRIDPDVTCQWAWEDDTTLTCESTVDDQLFPGASVFGLQISEGLWSQAGVALMPRHVRVESSRPELHAEISSWDAGIPQLRLWADQPTTAEAVAAALLAEIDGHPARFAVEISPQVPGHGGRRGFSYTVRLLEIPASMGHLTLRVRPGLRSAAGPLPGIQDEVLLQALLNEPFRLRYVRCESGVENQPGAVLEVSCAPETAIRLYFSRAPSVATLAAIRSTMPIGWSVLAPKKIVNSWDESPSKIQRLPDFIVSLKSDLAETNLRLPVDASWTASGGAPIVGTSTLALHIKSFRPAARIIKPVLFAPIGSVESPVLETRNLEKAPRLIQLEIDELARVHRFRPRLSAQGNQGRQATLPIISESLRAHGGLVLGGARDEAPLAYAAAYAPFNVLVRGDKDRLLIWASTWGDSRNLSAANVELLEVDPDGKQTVLSRGVTGNDGVATLPAPTGKPRTESELPRLVRVSQGGLQTIVPVLSWSFRIKVQTEAASIHRDYSQDDGATRSFGVSDRPIYRPGELVNYRLWLRQRHGNKLLRPKSNKMDLRFSSIGDKTLKSWSATLDELGSVSGQLQLPQQLPDDFYCIAVDSEDDEDFGGACFDVARFESQPIWAKLQANRKTVMAGESLRLDTESGYFSGDAAADVAVRLQGLLTPRRLEDSYPEFAGYTFIDPFAEANASSGINPLQGSIRPTRTDRAGKASFVWQLPKEFRSSTDSDTAMPFGLLEFTAEVSIPGKASAHSAPTAVNYSQYNQYVGLKSDKWWLPIGDDPELEAVVITSDGKALAGRPVQVSIEAADSRDGDEGQATVLGSCQLISGRQSRCAFRAPRPGRYLFRASAEGAATTVMTRYIDDGAKLSTDNQEALASLKLLRGSDGASAARVALRQPHARANVLFVLEHEQVITHWVQLVTSRDSEIEVPVKAEWAPGATLHALIRRADEPAAGFASPTLDAALDLEIPRLSQHALTISLDRGSAAPGEEVVLRVSNPTGLPRHATIAVVDDSVYQQALDSTQFADPDNATWLGDLSSWSRGIWYGLEGWSHFNNPFYVARPPSKQRRQQPVVSFGYERDRAALDTIVVTGTRISETSKFVRSLQAEITTRQARSRPGQNADRVRADFVDSAYWNPDVPLAAGESKELRIRLPDNLTRWRALVWSSDAGDGFALTQTTFESALPLEIRMGAPGQLYVGDHASATASVRNHNANAAAVSLQVHATGAGVQLQQSRQGTIAGNAELSKRIEYKPDTPGDIDMLARASKSGAGDAMSTRVSVLARMGEEHLVQSGWIDTHQVTVTLPPLPAGASSPVLELQLNRGVTGWRDGWLRELRDYPHRCWEQTLSRAVGAAIAINSGQDKTLWPEARQQVDETLTVAATFQDEDGLFNFFVSDDDRWNDSGNPVLSAYTLRSFAFLTSLGYTPPKAMQEDLEEAVASNLDDWNDADPADTSKARLEIAAQLAGALPNASDVPTDALNKLWNGWTDLSWYGRSELVRALSRQPKLAELARAGIERLREAGTQQGERRVIRDERDFNYALGSDLRDQCAVTATLFELDKCSAGERARNSLLRGLQDLYAGGTASLDTQASAQCLLALQAMAKEPANSATEQQVLVTLGTASKLMQLAPGETRAVWSQAVSPYTGTASPSLQLQSQSGAEATLNYSADLHYQLDLQQATPHAIGMRLERSYQILRKGAWVELAGAAAQEGDWIRIRLQLNVPAMRHFVAITDIVPGGLVSRDISLSSVGGADVKRLADSGSWWFGSRQTGQNEVRLYAEQLPPGRHEVYYYAQAVQTGDYFAPPAVAELMYGRASRATTAPLRLRIAPASPAADVRH